MPIFGRGSDEEKEGIFIYRGEGRWERVDGIPPIDKPLLLYFSNLKCPFCKVFDTVWDLMVDDPKLQGLTFVKVVCSFFESNCRNPASKKAFREHEVDRSPLLLLIAPREGGAVEKTVILPSEHGYDYIRVRDAVLRQLKKITSASR